MQVDSRGLAGSADIAPRSWPAGRAEGHVQQADADGKGGTIAPTGKAFAIDMVAVGIWNR
jgi:hypothetical protein